MASIDHSRSPTAPETTPSRKAGGDLPAKREVIYRHRLPVRITHWLNAWFLAVLLMSGLQIFNAQPNLYWGRQGFEIFKPLLSIHAAPTPNGVGKGVTVVAGHAFDTTGVLGLSKVHGRWTPRAWPVWTTLPSDQDLADGRRWHFFFAWLFVLNGLAYGLWAVFSRHLTRDLIPARAQLRTIGRSILDHVLLRHPAGEAAKRYNVLQKLAYLAAMFALLPLMVATGLTMSPGVDSALPGLLEVFGGRQSARTIHFACASLLVLFFLVHIAEVILAGPLNEVRSIVTGRYAVPPPTGHDREG